MTIFGQWLRDRNRRIARAVAGDDRAAGQLAGQAMADPLGVDLEATWRAMDARIKAEQRRQAVVDATRPVPCVGAPEGCREGIRVAQDAPPQTFVCSPRCEARAQERKEQSIIAALAFGCWCGDGRPPWADREVSMPEVAAWLRTHAHCGGLGAMVRDPPADEPTAAELELDRLYRRHGIV